MAKMYRVRTSKDGGLELNEADYKAWKAAGGKEYGGRPPADDEQPTVADPEAEPDSPAMDAPAEKKQVVSAPKKKAE